MENWAFTNPFWPIERVSEKKITRTHEMDPLIIISVQLVALAQKVEQMNVVLTVGLKLIIANKS